MVDTATANYLSDNIGGTLSKALAEMAIAQPANGVEFLAEWLRGYQEQEQDKERIEQEQEKLRDDRAAAKKSMDEQEARQQARREKKQQKEVTYQELLKRFSDPETEFQESFWLELVNAASIYSGAKSSYLGLRDDEGLVDQPGPLITYQEATADAKMMIEQVLPAETGVTWGAVTENPGEEVPYLWKPPKEPAPEVEGDGGDEPPKDETPSARYLPVSIPCVTDTIGGDAKKVHFFDMTRLGAFLAVPLIYKSYYSEEARTQAKAFEAEKKEKELKRAEKQQEYDDAVVEALKESQEAADAVPRPPELDDVEEKPMELTGTAVKMVLCMDTLGANTSIEESKFEPLITLCEACGKCKERTEKRQVDSQAILEIGEEAREALREKIRERRSAVETELQDEGYVQGDLTALADLEEDQKELMKQLVTKKWDFVSAARVLMDLKEEFVKLKTWVVVPKEMRDMVVAAALLFGYKEMELLPKRKKDYRWDVLSKVIDERFFKIIEDAGDIAKQPVEQWLDLEPKAGEEEDAEKKPIKKEGRAGEQADVLKEKKSIQNAQKMKSIRDMAPAAFDDEQAMALAPELGLLGGVIKGACEYRQAHLRWVKGQYSKRKAKAEAEEQPFEEKPLEERDDDFEALDEAAA